MNEAEYDRFLEAIPFPKGEVERLGRRVAVLERHVRPNSRVAEIGVFRGHFSEIIQERLKPSILYMVDRWTLAGPAYNWGVTSEYGGFGKLTTQQAKDDARRRLLRFQQMGSVELVEMHALEFAEDMRRKGEKLDLVYLDTSHLYRSTLAELLALQHIVAEEGLIIGDDWEPDPKHEHHGVVLAVNDFVRHSEFNIIAAGQGRQYCLKRCKKPGSTETDPGS